MSDPAQENVAVLGLGKLGLPLACLLARGHRVHGIDASPEVVEAIRGGRYEGSEPAVDQLLAAHRDRLSVHSQLDSIADTRMAFVLVPTPSDADDRFSLEHVIPAVESIAREVARANLEQYTIVLVSTVMPGSCDGAVWDAIAKAAGPRFAHRIELVYSPEFVALGDVVRGMRRPDLLLVGAECEEAGQRVAEVLLSIVENSPSLVVTTRASAELAKLAVNAFVSFKVASANLLAQVCHALPRAHVDDVCRAVGADGRIGPRYLRGGLGFGGPCLPRDVRALAAVCRQYSMDDGLPRAVSLVNDNLPAKIVELLNDLPLRERRIGVLGLAYRPGTRIVEASQALVIARRMAEDGYEVFVHDPLVCPNDVDGTLGHRMVWCASPAAVLRRARCIVIATPDPAYAELDPQLLTGHTVLDCWRRLSPRIVAQGRQGEGKFWYIPFGVGRGWRPLRRNDRGDLESRCAGEETVGAAP